MEFQNLGLNESLLRAVAGEGYTLATPIQAQSIPVVLEGRDLLGRAQTGSGKTAAFALPVLQRLAESARPVEPTAAGDKRAHRRRSIRALVMAPTRELAAQIRDSFAVYGKHLSQRSTAVYGGVSQGSQVEALRSGVDILVATPGRLLDLVNQGHIDLSKIEVFVVDEADHMLDMGFLPDLRRIHQMLPDGRQTLLFSATMPDEIRQLASRWLNDPKYIELKPSESRIEQLIYWVEPQHKPELLTLLLQEVGRQRTLVFSRTKHGADKIVKRLTRAGIYAAAIHGDKTQRHRTLTLDKFRSDRPPVLVATDVAARGLDIDEVAHVINYELPEVPETYVHRIGRTGRAGAVGQATSFCSYEERNRLSRIEGLTRQKLNVEPFQPEGAPDMELPAPEEGWYEGSDDSQQSESRRDGAERGRRPRSNGSGRGRRNGAGRAARPTGGNQGGNHGGGNYGGHDGGHGQARGGAGRPGRRGAAGGKGKRPGRAGGQGQGGGQGGGQGRAGAKASGSTGDRSSKPAAASQGRGKRRRYSGAL